MFLFPSERTRQAVNRLELWERLRAQQTPAISTAEASGSELPNRKPLLRSTQDYEMPLPPSSDGAGLHTPGEPR